MRQASRHTCTSSCGTGSRPGNENETGALRLWAPTSKVKEFSIAGGKCNLLFQQTESVRVACETLTGVFLYGPQILGAHAEAAHMEVVVFYPGVPTKGGISILKDGERAAVEVGHVVVDPLLPKPLVITKVTRQPLQRVQEPRCADVGVARGVAHRSARRCQLVIGLFLAEPKERIEMEKTADATSSLLVGSCHECRGLRGGGR
eukprot:scaffold4498_cov119-Isochrysis_galbana.AAC.10